MEEEQQHRHERHLLTLDERERDDAGNAERKYRLLSGHESHTEPRGQALTAQAQVTRGEGPHERRVGSMFFFL